MVRKILRICAVILAAATLIAVSGCGGGDGGSATSALTATFLKVGKADAMVLQCGGEVMVIDTGEEDDGQELVSFLTDRGISSVDCLVITHYDKDHVGGADTLVRSVEIERIILPDYEGSSTEYADFMAAVTEKGYTPQRISQDASFSFGSAQVTVEPPQSYEITNANSEYDNNFSLVVKIDHGSNRLLFMGDAEKQRILSWIEQGKAEDCDFIKWPHHGVYNSALRELLESTTPEHAVITCSDKNPPDSDTLELLAEKGVDVLMTKDGDITLISDGEKLELHQ
ncbi:MAG: MBL fold metallo-hydrolase [Oscillospiraceae bacterium]|nr:MBL fold metallo-hydrolase [Oscillospiraceae bacterium]